MSVQGVSIEHLTGQARVLSWGYPAPLYSFPSHAHLETFLEAAILALVPVVLVDGTRSVASARVRQVPSDGTLEEALAALARELAVVFAGRLVRAHDTFYVGALGVRVRGVVVVVVGCWCCWDRGGC